MSEFYQLYEDYFLDFGITHSPSFQSQSLFTGVALRPQELPPLIYQINVPDQNPCPHFMTTDSVVVSQRFIEVLQKYGATNFQTFPITLTNPETGSGREGYFLFNVLGLIEKSHLRPENLISRIPDDPTILVVSQFIKMALLQNKPPEGWGIIFEELD